MRLFDYAIDREDGVCDSMLFWSVVYFYVVLLFALFIEPVSEYELRNKNQHVNVCLLTAYREQNNSMRIA